MYKYKGSSIPIITLNYKMSTPERIPYQSPQFSFTSNQRPSFSINVYVETRREAPFRRPLSNNIPLERAHTYSQASERYAPMPYSPFQYHDFDAFNHTQAFI